MNIRLTIILLVLIFLSSACHQVDGQPAALTETVPFKTKTDIATATESAITVTPLATLLPSPQPETIFCRPHQIGVELAETGFEGYPELIQVFLNEGGAPDVLDEQLCKLGIANQPVSVDHADMTGDGRYDMVVSIYNPNSTTVPPDGLLLVYVCNNGYYQLVYEEASLVGWGAPGIRYLQDLNGSNVSELIVSSVVCGAHTCLEAIQILAWDGKGIKNVLEGETTDMPFPDIRLIDPDGDGVFTMEVTSSGFGSIGAGPQREVTRLWVFDKELSLWRLDANFLQSSNYRIHMVHDADAAAEKMDYRQALALYGRVVNDASLDDWSDPEKERAVLAAYALFKTGLIHYLRGNDSIGQSTFDQLRAAYPAGSHQEAYVELVDLFQEVYEERGFKEACTTVRVFVGDNPELMLDSLGPIQFGYANKDFSPRDICPWDW